MRKVLSPIVKFQEVINAYNNGVDIAEEYGYLVEGCSNFCKYDILQTLINFCNNYLLEKTVADYYGLEFVDPYYDCFYLDRRTINDVDFISPLGNKVEQKKFYTLKAVTTQIQAIKDIVREEGKYSLKYKHNYTYIDNDGRERTGYVALHGADIALYIIPEESTARVIVYNIDKDLICSDVFIKIPNLLKIDENYLLN